MHWSNDKKLETGDGWLDADWKTNCGVCKKECMRSELKLKDGEVRCKECLEEWMRKNYSQRENDTMG